MIRAKKTGPRKPNERAAGFRETATFEKEEKEKEERKGIKREKWSGRRWRERGKESGLERRADRDGRGIHSPRVMRSSPPGGMNELWKELAIGGAKEGRRGKRGG